MNITTESEACVVDGCYGSDLLQINDIRNDNDRLLDLIFTNNYYESSVEIASHRLLPDEIHHKALEISVMSANISRPSSDTYPHPQSPLFDFRRLNYIALNSFFAAIDWKMVFEHPEIDQNVEAFYATITTGLNTYPGFRRTYTTSKRVPWENQFVRNLKHKKKKAHRKYTQSNRSIMNYTFFSEIRKQYKQAAKIAKDRYLSKMESSLKSNPKSFFKFINERRRSNAIPSSMKYNDLQANELQDIADLFAKFFGSVYTPTSSSTPHVPNPYTNLNDSLNIPRVEFSSDDILQALRKLKDTFDPGPDSLPQGFLRNCAQSLAFPSF